MMLFRYLDALPAIPDHLLSADDLINRDIVGYRDDMYIRYGISKNLITWIGENITKHINISGIQEITGEVPPHSDKRKWALNYILDTGGPEVHTNFLYQQEHELVREPGTRPIGLEHELSIVYSKVIEPYRWHILNTNVYHSVTGITGTRKAITIGINLPNVLDAIKGYAGSIYD